MSWSRIQWSLRPAEMFRLKIQHILITRSDAMVLVLDQPKTRSVAARVQFSTIRCPVIIRRAEWFCSGVNREEHVWPSSIKRFHAMCREILSSMNAAHLSLSVSSSRPGGASDLFIQGVSADHIKFLGLWMADRSMVCYLQEVVARIVEAHHFSAAPSFGSMLEMGRRFLARPPFMERTHLCASRASWRSHR